MRWLYALCLSVVLAGFPGAEAHYYDETVVIGDGFVCTSTQAPKYPGSRWAFWLCVHPDGLMDFAACAPNYVHCFVCTQDEGPSYCSNGFISYGFVNLAGAGH